MVFFFLLLSVGVLLCVFIWLNLLGKMMCLGVWP